MIFARSFCGGLKPGVALLRWEVKDGRGGATRKGKAMAGAGKKWLIGCGGGCAAVVVLSIVVTIGGGIIMMRPFDKAIDDRQALEEEFGTPEDYVPPVDGLTADRILRFLAVREGVLALCDDFEGLAADFRRMDELDRGEEKPSTGEVLKGVGNIMGTVMQLPGLLGKLSAERNELLLANRMSLGEYIWIYVLAYHSWLGYEPNTSFDDEHEGSFSAKEIVLIRRMMNGHADALDAAGRAAEARLWREEAGRLKRSAGGTPFATGDLPREITGALGPYRGKFQASFCPAMAGLDLTRVHKSGLSIQAE